MTRRPLWIEMEGLNILVVGGGNVGTRRALWFLEAGSNVTVVALSFSPQLVRETTRNPRLHLVACDAADCALLENLVEWADIVVLAVGDERVRERVWRIARARRRLVNDATDASVTQVVVPYHAKVVGGMLEVAVTSQGVAGVAARHALYTVVACLEADSQLRTLLTVFSRSKKLVKNLVGDPSKRMSIYMELERELVAKGAVGKGVEEALEAAAKVIAKAVGLDPEHIAEMLRGV